MNKPKVRHRRINPIAREPILRKGGEHKVSKGGERQQAKQSLKRQLRQEAGASSLSDQRLCA
ncbi:hypothetical protein [Thiofilum flexile]|uniref:hypothetical protein n=1 Tax=Thiofilum flexile TaxID=125627 RepID=UPI0003733C71|nr:hypothetical protein [Thiofilum flexile]